ncbi:hypothetical protein [Sphingomonas sp.]|uniref:hypothetical protein n=1 Tax=Sphingomonas sp. TaxID=28214 RepID=UPI003B005E58
MNNNSHAAPSRTTILSIKNKGGVGGSHIAMATATVMRMVGARHFTTALIDLDGSTGTSINRIGERDPDGMILADQTFEAGVPAFNVLRKEERDKLFDITEIEDRFLILDGPATSLDTFGALTENLAAPEWVEHNRACGRSLIVMIPITPSLSSIVDVPKAIELFGPDAHYVVVRSMRGCSPDDYVLWDAPDFPDRYGRVVSGRSKARLAEVGGVVLDMPALNAGVLARAEALKITFDEAVGSTQLRAAERISVRNWLAAWAQQLRGIHGLLGLDAEFAWRFA